MVTVEQVGEDEWARLRDVRIRALTDAPDAFGSSLARELGFGERHWRMRLRGSRWWLAADDVPDGGVRDVGVVCLIEEPGAQADERHVVSFWVDPGHRRRGIGSALLAALEDEARRAGAAAVTLWQIESNAGPAVLYRARGYAPTGVTMPLPRDPTQTEQRWRLSL